MPVQVADAGGQPVDVAVQQVQLASDQPGLFQFGQAPPEPRMAMAIRRRIILVAPYRRRLGRLR